MPEMSRTSEAETGEVVAAELQKLRKDWAWVLVLGIGLVITGIIAVSAPWLMTVGVVTLLGILMLIAGAGQIVSAFTSAQWSGALLHVFVGILYAVIGFLVLENNFLFFNFEVTWQYLYDL